MNIDFHYYATYLAAIIAGYSHEESSEIAYSAQFVDCCTRTFLTSIKAPLSAATTQSQVELINARADLLGLQNITRIWSAERVEGEYNAHYVDERHERSRKR